MSYDITIQSDDAHSQEVDLEALKSFIRDIPDMNQEWETGFTYGDGAVSSQLIMLPKGRFLR